MRRTFARTAAVAATALLAFGGLTGCDDLSKYIDVPGSSEGTLEAPAEMEDDYFTVVGAAERTYEPAEPGVVEYCDLDELERTICAYGELTSTLRSEAQERGRQDISVDPTGLTDNAETSIPALTHVDGSKDYSGWFWNRSHMVADSLGGDPFQENLVTGTRTQNVGSATIDGEYAGGMAHTEVIARDYLDENDGDACPLYYAATANYEGDELVPRTVTVDIQSCDGAIDERVEVSNTAAGHEINYATGEWAPTS